MGVHLACSMYSMASSNQGEFVTARPSIHMQQTGGRTLCSAWISRHVTICTCVGSSRQTGMLTRLHVDQMYNPYS